jgi:hypothetical protein
MVAGFGENLVAFAVKDPSVSHNMNGVLHSHRAVSSKYTIKLPFSRLKGQECMN